MTVNRSLSGELAFPLEECGYNFNKPENALISITLKASTRCTPIEIRITDLEKTVEAKYYIPVQKTKIIIPIEVKSAPTLWIKTEGDVDIYELKCDGKGEKDFKNQEMKGGMFLSDSYDRIELSEDGIGVGATVDMVRKGGFLYSIGDGSLCVINLSQADCPTIEGRLCGLGEVRQIAVCEDGEHVIVTSRQNGAFIINVSDPRSPYIRATYDSIEMATGLCISGNYAFICVRQYGVEVVDISDLSAPKHVTNMRLGGEVQSCTVRNGVFYGGTWGEMCVVMYDVSDPVHPNLLGKAHLNGKGDGMCIAEYGGKTYLYAATGQHSKIGLPLAAPLTELDFGQGNGLDIFDVTDPSAPVLLSVSKTEGRYYYSGYDYWETEYGVDREGHRYVYLVSTFNGVYIFNVDDPCAPIRLATVTVPISKKSPKYKYFNHEGRTIVFPFDEKEETRSPIGAICVDEGRIYLAGTISDVHVLESAELCHTVTEEADKTEIAPSPYAYCYDYSEVADGVCNVYRTEGQAYSVFELEGLLYCAAGTEGVIVLDSEMNRIATVSVDETVMDVAVLRSEESEIIMLTAEKNAGLGVYRLNGNVAEFIGRYNDVCVRQIRLSPDQRYAVLHISGSIMRVVKLDDLSTVMERRTRTLMYHQNLSPVIDGRYIGFWDNTPLESWIDFCSGNPETVVEKRRSLINMRSGCCEYRDANGNAYLLEITSKGGIALQSADDLRNEIVNVPSVASGFMGKPTVCGERLVTCDRIGGKVNIVDISHISAPKILRSFVLAGNPGIACYHAPFVYIPLSYGGILRIDLSKIYQKALS